jgi:hypothetical protein
MPDLLFDRAKWSQDGEGFWLSLKVRAPAIAKEFAAGMKEKIYVATLKEYRQKRSLDANALFWKAASLIAEHIGSDKDSVYLMLLSRYGVFTHIVVKPQAVEQFKQSYRLCEEVGEVTVAGQTGIQLRCYFGSSTFNSKQMSRLIDGAISELKEMGIDFVPESDISKAKEEWGH